MKDHHARSEQRDGDDERVADQARRDREERDTRADEREIRLNQREDRIDAWESAQADRLHQAQQILADADDRDDDADDRDSVAATRDTAASLHSFLTDNEAEFGPALKARRSAAVDRSDSKADRTAAAADRSHLVHGDPIPADAEEDPDPHGPFVDG